MADRTPDALSRAVREVLAQEVAPDAVRNYAEQFSWDATSHGQVALFATIANG